MKKHALDNIRAKIPSLTGLKKVKPVLKKFWWIPAGLFLLFLIGGGYAFSKREQLFRERLEAMIRAQRSENKLDIHIERSGFSGLSTVKFRGVSVTPVGKDTLLNISDLEVGIRIWPLLFGKVKLKKLNLSDGNLHLVSKNGEKNYDFLFKGKRSGPPDPDRTPEPGSNLAALANNLLNEALYKIPARMEVSRFGLHIDDDSLSARLLAKEIRIKNKKLSSTFILNRDEAVWHLEGRVAPSRKQLDVYLFAENQPLEIPYLNDKYQLKVRFDTIFTKMDAIRYRNKELKIEGSWAVSNLRLEHAAVADTTLVVKNASIDAEMHVGRNWISIDSASTGKLKDITFHPYIKYTLPPEKAYELVLFSENMDAQAFFDSFPPGLFGTLEGMKVKGNLSYRLDFSLNDSIPDSVKFNSGLKQENFEIVRFGKTDFGKITGTFVHTPHSDGEALASFRVGPSNPDYVPYEQIPDYLKDAINMAEDGDFFGHLGFNEEAFRKSIALNYKTREFKRGGSTISMQLVKNVFLDREKTIARKLEELMIVWLIEHERLVSKQRMFEVYLNVIEWGPDLYGIGPAARFYFAKAPADLSLSESIYLASIIPSPGNFAWHWNGDGTIRSSRHWYYQLIRDLMLKRGQLSEAEAADYFYNLRLTGPALAWTRNNAIEYQEPDTLEIQRQDRGILEELETLFGAPPERQLQPAAPPEPAADTLSKRERRKLERQKRRAERRRNQ